MTEFNILIDEFLDVKLLTLEMNDLWKYINENELSIEEYNIAMAELAGMEEVRERREAILIKKYKE